jgi:Predicted membrane protein
MKKNCANQERIMGVGTVLLPNWSEAFQINDPRCVGVMLPERFVRFIRSMLVEPDESKIPKRKLSIQNRDSLFSNGFTGCEPELIRAASKVGQENSVLKRFAAVASVRHLISVEPTFLMTAILSQNQDKKDLHLQQGIVTIDSQPRVALVQPPPIGRSASITNFDTVVPKDQSTLQFSYGIASAAVRQGGDGAKFGVVLQSAEGEKVVFEKFLNPRLRPGEDRWHSQRIDLSQFAGAKVRILFGTLSGPDGRNFGDQTCWSKIYWCPTGGNSKPTDLVPGLTRVYDEEATIYKLDKILPRAGFFKSVEYVEDDDTVLQKLRDPSFDIFRRVILSGKQDAKPAFEREPLGKGAEVFPQHIEEYKSQFVRIALQVSERGVVMLNDTFYPGWKAYVDGRERPIVRANFLFRGVAVNPEDRVLEFRYEPKSFQLGLALSILGVLSLLGLVVSEFFGHFRNVAAANNTQDLLTDENSLVRLK